MRAWLLLLLLAGSLLPHAPRASAASTAEISRETLRAHRVERRVVNFWWLPLEYWEASARELGRPEEDVERVRKLLAPYLVVGVIDAGFGKDGKAEAREHADLVSRMEVRRNGEELRVLRELNPEIAKQLPELSYFLTVSLGPLASVVRLLFYPNLTDQGQPIATGSARGTVSIRYRNVEAQPPLELYWHAPLTSVAGGWRCPEGGEPLEASWSYCPWHGVPAGAGSELKR